MASGVVLIDDDVLELLRLNNGIIAFGFVMNGYPVVYPTQSLFFPNFNNFFNTISKCLESIRFIFYI
jgi:hypothetical protein